MWKKQQKTRLKQKYWEKKNAANNEMRKNRNCARRLKKMGEGGEVFFKLARDSKDTT